MPRALILILAASGLVACKTRAPLFCDQNTPCMDPDRPFCDLEGDFPESEGHGRTCIANPFDAGVVPCEANETVCTADTLSVCDADGNLASQTTCHLGCHPTELRCNKLDPSNGLAPHLDDAELEGDDIVLGDGVTIESNTGEVRNGDGALVNIPNVLLPAPNGGVEIRVFKVRSLTVGDTTVTGQTAIAIVSPGPVRVLGKVELEPFITEPINPTCSYPDYTQSSDAPGGPGGGFGTPGGSGGASAGVLAPEGGNAIGNEALEPLIPGCPGRSACLLSQSCGTVCFEGLPCGTNGLGGKAIQISSNEFISIGDSNFAGSIEAHGGGATGPTQPTPVFDGRGGGSGGAVLLEAGSIVVDVASGVGANGGGGSCESRDGLAGALAGGVNGATCTAPNGSGGSGATRDRGARDGAGSATGSGGGGGGGVGRIRINTRDRQFDERGTLSPQPFVGNARTR